jgi:hypothetical protein
MALAHPPADAAADGAAGMRLGLAAPRALSGAKHLRRGLGSEGGSMPAASFFVAYCQKVLPWPAAVLRVALQPGIENLEFPTP